MALYEETMRNLRFSEDFREKTLQKMEEPAARHRLPRALLTAACVCLCLTLLFGTVWAASPAFRTLFLPNEQVGTAERPALPGEANTVTVRELGSLTARCYKLNGHPCTREGYGGLFPVLEDGVPHYYRLTGDALEEVFPSRRLQHRLEYDGEVYDLDLTIYDGDDGLSTCLMDAKPHYDAWEDVISVPMYDPNTLTIWRYRGDPQICSPIFVDLTTWEVSDPMANVDFTPPEDTVDVYVSSFIGGRNVLIECDLKDGSWIFYHADAVTGEVTQLEENLSVDRVFVEGDHIWSNPEGDLCLLGEDGAFASVLEESEKGRFRVVRWGHYAGLFPKEKAGDDLTLIDLNTGERLVLEQGAAYFSTSESTVSSSRDRTGLALTEVEANRDLAKNKAVALVDLTDGRLVTFERVSGLSEKMWGWLDNDHFVIAGTMGGEWYLCSYSFD